VTVLAVEAVMLGTSVTSATCCLASTRSAGPHAQVVHARVLAIVMVISMAGVVATDDLRVHFVAAGALVGVSLVLLSRRRTESGALTTWHRGLGGLLMAAAIIVHAPHAAHMGQPAMAEMAGMGGMGAMHGSGGSSASAVIQVASVMYVVWTVAVILRARHRRPRGRLLHWEHAAMAASLATMTVGMSV
jgi:hypothetical protein